MITTGAISISQALMVNQTLLELHMENNGIGDEGITAIAASLSNSSITELYVMRCGITFTGVKSLAAALSTNHNIRLLVLTDNDITVDGARLILKSAVDNGVCKYVVIDGKHNDDDQVNQMITILDDRIRQDIRNYEDDGSSEEQSLEVFVMLIIIIYDLYCYHGNRSYHSNSQLQWIQQVLHKVLI